MRTAILNDEASRYFASALAVALRALFTNWNPPAPHAGHTSPVGRGRRVAPGEGLRPNDRP
jgi:hypothetical protein